MYTLERTVYFSDCGPDEILRPSNIVNYFQDCSTAQSESLGVGSEYTRSLHKAWILSAWQICINRRPRMGEKVLTKTWPSGFEGFYGYRNYTLETEDSEVLAYANSVWVYMDTERKRPCRMSEKEKEAYKILPAYPMENASRKIEVAEETTVLDAMRVGRIHLDCNGHMNNAKYVEMAMECVPDGYKPRQIRVDYRKEAQEGAIVVPKLAIEKERIVVELCDTEEHIYATVEFTGEEK